METAAKLAELAHVEPVPAQQRVLGGEVAHIRAEAERLAVEAVRLRAETEKLGENVWEAVVGVGAALEKTDSTRESGMQMAKAAQEPAEKKIKRTLQSTKKIKEELEVIGNDVGKSVEEIECPHMELDGLWVENHKTHMYGLLSVEETEKLQKQAEKGTAEALSTAQDTKTLKADVEKVGKEAERTVSLDVGVWNVDIEVEAGKGGVSEDDLGCGDWEAEGGTGQEV
ncbi:hypothetical protein DFP73DRAFT_600699 [Morchella snyderi]|nr:hypothetical protein DFP73DRAFT_600699 [Morchella snyderi]